MASDLKKWKAKAWAAFSAYIRQKYSNIDGFAECVTCGVVKHWKEMQAGHFIDGRGNAVLYNERLVRVQCYSCNVCKHGNKVNYTLYMMNTGHSIEWIEHAESLKHKVVKMNANDHKQIYEIYKEWLK